MEDGDDHERPVSARGGQLSQCLEELDVAARRILRGIFENLPRLIYDEQETRAAGFGHVVRCLLETRHNIAYGAAVPSAIEALGQPADFPKDRRLGTSFRWPPRLQRASERTDQQEIEWRPLAG
jgi:hypothetical protein